MSLSTPDLSLQAPAKARIAAQETQIAELVKKTRDNERKIRDLQQELASEKERGAEALNEIKEKWKIENQQWHDGYEAVQERHRLATLDVRLALENERGFRLEDKELLIQEKAKRLVKEYELTLLRANQTKLLFQIDTLEDQVGAHKEELEQIAARHKAQESGFKAKLDQLESRREEQTQEVTRLKEDKQKYEVDLSELRTLSNSSSKQVDRLSLQVESLRTQNTALETRNKELQHQIDKWQTLEGKGEKEIEEHRKRRIELEFRVKELESEARGAQKKISKLEAALLEAQEQVEQTGQELGLARSEAAEVEKRAAEWEEQVEQLRIALETERIQIQKSDKPKPASVRTASLPPGDSASDQETKTSEEPERKMISRKNKSSKRKVDQPLRTAKTRPQSSKEPENDVGLNRISGPGNTDSSDAENTVRADPNEPDIGTKPRMKRKAKETIHDGNGKRLKVGPTSQKNAEIEVEDEQPAKKKRRKLNVKGVFANAPGFSFAQTGDGALDIPSVLSPVKEGQQVPPRFGTLGSMLRF